MTNPRARAISLIKRLPASAARAGGPQRIAALLSEEGRHFTGLSIEEADWLRGHIYAALAMARSPPTASAREDLGTSSSPVVLAGIARLLAAAGAGPEWTADIDEAVRRIRFGDIYPDFLFDAPSSCCNPAKSCRAELEAARAIVAAGSGALDTDDSPEDLGPVPAPALAARLEDQSCAKLSLNDVRDALVLVPFYTRCMNPLKCSLAISRLGEAAKSFGGLSYIGLTYDPAFDTPRRLLGYGINRGFPFGEMARLVRCDRAWASVRSGLQLRAGYGASTVNAHQRELLLIDARKHLWRLPPAWILEPARIEAHAMRAVIAG